MKKSSEAQYSQLKMSTSQTKIDFKNTYKEIKSFLKAIILKQQALYSLLYLNRSCIDYIRRFALSIYSPNYDPPNQSMIDFDEKKFDQQLYHNILQSFLSNLNKIFKQLSELRRKQYSIFIHNEIIHIKNLVKNWKDASPIKIDFSMKEEIDEDQQIERQYSKPNTEEIYQIINQNASQFLFLYKTIYEKINYFLQSLDYNQQAFYSLLYLIQSIDKFLNQAGLSINIDASISYSIDLYEEFYNEEIYNKILLLFFYNLAETYNEISSNKQNDPMKSIMSLNSFIEIEIRKATKMTENWSFLHVYFPNWNIKQLYS